MLYHLTWFIKKINNYQNSSAKEPVLVKACNEEDLRM